MVKDTYTRQVFDQQWTDCIQIQEMSERQFTQTTTSKGVKTGKFTDRTDLSYQEAHGLEDEEGSQWDSATVRSETLSRASGASSASIITGAG